MTRPDGSSAAEPPPEEKKGESEKGEVSKPGDQPSNNVSKTSAEDISNDSPSRGGGEKQAAGDKRSRSEGPGEESLKPGETASGETPAKKNKSELARFYETAIGGGDQVWPLTQFFSVSFFCENSLICSEGKSMTPHRGNTILFRSSQQLPRLRLRTSKGFLS